MITINYLSHTRPNYSDLTFHYLRKIKKQNKGKIILNILASVYSDWDVKSLDLGIETNIHVITGGNNYNQKLNIAVQSDTPYSIKLDEDCFINNHILDYMIENVHQLDDPENLLMSPIMTNNIPSCDLFISNAIKDDVIRNEIYEYFLNRPMPNGLWGVNYVGLNEYTIDADNWDYTAFYKGVNKMDTQTKGIHPLRISAEAQLKINDYVLNNIDIINKEHKYNLIEFDAPYFTNSLFMIKTDVWRTIVANKVDAYDEISLNNYKRDNNKKILFINNGFGLHLMYNTIYGNQNKWGIGVANGEELEKEFYNNIKNIIL